MFTPSYSKEAQRVYDALKDGATKAAATRRKKSKAKSSKQEGLFKQVNKALQLLKNNPRHTGLHTHEYGSIPNPFDEQQKVFEAYAQNDTSGAYRIFWCYGPKKGQIYIIAITTHP